MTERLIEILKNSGADDYEITINDTKAWEFYFIRHELDQNRVRNTKEISVKVYKKSEDGSSLGFATAVIPPTASDEEIEKTVKDLVFQASLLKNRPFELTGPGESSI
ncbi:MAG: TldD/PmbA family protein, partial [Clostridia bacterium]|nr:TldD/PmbA family protein [Clostridia bacterium]